MIFGIRAVIEAVEAGKEIDKILVKKDLQGDLAKELFDLIKGFKMILDGEVDYLPEQAFLNVGTIEEAIEKGKKLLDAASHKK